MSDSVHVPTTVIDADGHVVEPLEAWTHLPEDHRPLIHSDASGYEHVVVGGQEILAVPLGTLATPGATFADPSQLHLLGRGPTRRFGPGGPPGRHGSRRHRSSGPLPLHRALLLGAHRSHDGDPGRPPPTTTGCPTTAPPIRIACLARPCFLCRTRRRQSRELRRAVEQLGFKAAFVRPNPCMGRSLSDTAYEPVWNVAEELGVPIAVHEGSSVIVPTLGSDRPFNPLILHAVSHSFEEMLACAQLMAFGTLDRHPGLQFVFLESGGGWVPFWLERLDEQFETFGGFCPEMPMRPSEYFARQCAISFEVDEATLTGPVALHRS